MNSGCGCESEREITRLSGISQRNESAESLRFGPGIGAADAAHRSDASFTGDFGVRNEGRRVNLS